MEFYLSTSDRPYKIQDVNKIRTPRLLVFQDRVLDNIKTMGRLLAQANPNMSLAHVCPHVKTHKSKWVTKELLNAGISFFKTTLNELNILLEAGASDIFIAYPLLNWDAKHVKQAIKAHPHARVYVQLSHPTQVDILKRCSENDVTWFYFIDVNVGMDRTGLAPEQALDFYQVLAADPRFEFVGLHAYDGHIHHVSANERRDQSQKSMDKVWTLLNNFYSAGICVKKTVVAGTPSFLHDAEYFADKSPQTDLYVSPGTWVYFDTVSHDMMPNTFDIAAVILSQVMDKPTADTATLNIGHKRWAVDQGAIDTFSVPGMQATHWNEEHTVVRVPKDQHLNIGDYVLLAPRHVCSTVNLWEYFGIIDAYGTIVSTNTRVDARNL